MKNRERCERIDEIKDKIVAEFGRFLAANNVMIAHGSTQWLGLSINIEKILKNQPPQFHYVKEKPKWPGE